MKARSIALRSAVAGGCVAAGVLGGIAESSASKSHATARTAQAGTTGSTGAPGWPGRGGGPPGPGDGRAVHSVSVVLDKAGTAFVTATTDNGKIQSVDASGDSLTIVEGTDSVTYKTVTLTIPAGATISLDAKTSQLSSLVAGDRVSVSSSSDGTTVFATDSSFAPGHGPGGPGGPGPGGPPPGGGY